MTILDEFDRLTAQGLKIIPLRENSKRPLCKNWTKRWDRDYLRGKLKVFPESNLGILLGDIIDVEGDTEWANNTILRLIGDYPHPCYQSTKSIHHLFTNPDPNLRIFKVGAIEFRGKGHQSVLPPSSHQGIEYKWLTHLSEEIPPMPARLLQFYRQKRYHSKKVVKPDHTKVHCYECNKTIYIHKKRLESELLVFQLFQKPWQCQACRLTDIRRACRLVYKGPHGQDLILKHFDL